MEIALAPIQIIDAFFDCTLTEAEIDYLSDIPRAELHAMTSDCARALSLPMGTGDNSYYYVTERDLKGDRE